MSHPALVMSRVIIKPTFAVSGVGVLTVFVMPCVISDVNVSPPVSDHG